MYHTINNIQPYQFITLNLTSDQCKLETYRTCIMHYKSIAVALYLREDY